MHRFQPGVTTGKQAYAVVEEAMDKRRIDKQKHVSKASFARLCNLTTVTLWEFEKGKRDPGEAALHRIASAASTWGVPCEVVYEPIQDGNG